MRTAGRSSRPTSTGAARRKTETLAIRELREHRAPFETNLRAMTWLEAQARFTPIPFGLRHNWKGHLVSEASTGLADALLTAAEGSGDDGLSWSS